MHSKCTPALHLLITQLYFPKRFKSSGLQNQCLLPLVCMSSCTCWSIPQCPTNQWHQRYTTPPTFINIANKNDCVWLISPCSACPHLSALRTELTQRWGQLVLLGSRCDVLSWEGDSTSSGGAPGTPHRFLVPCCCNPSLAALWKFHVCFHLYTLSTAQKLHLKQCIYHKMVHCTLDRCHVGLFSFEKNIF